MDSPFWHFASLVVSGLGTCVAVLVMHIVGGVERSLTALQQDLTEVRERLARMEGAQERVE